MGLLPSWFTVQIAFAPMPVPFFQALREIEIETSIGRASIFRLHFDLSRNIFGDFDALAFDIFRPLLPVKISVAAGLPIPQVLINGYIKAAAKYNDLGFNSFFRTGWKRFYLKWYDKALPSAEALCPKTVELVKAVPHVHAAIFAILPPGGRLVRHRDPFAGSMRYHLGLSTPNSPDCFIVVDGENYFWRDGEGVVFDETYIHFAENKTDQTRLILFCDVERPLKSGIMTAINRFTVNHLVKATASQNMDNERVGVLNHVFAGAYRIRLLGKRIKAFNKTLYYLIKYVLIGALLYAIFA